MISVSSAAHFLLGIMSFLKIFASYPINIIRRATLSTSSVLWRAAEEEEEVAAQPVVETEKFIVKDKDWEKDRTVPIDVETSIRYMNSSAYKETYGDELVWVPYRRNHKGNIPGDTRKTCIRMGIVQTGNACPVCRDKYFVVHYENLKLLKQFISPYNGQLYSTRRTGVCRTQQRNLEIAIMQAKDRGLLTYDVPHRHYDYSVYMPKSSKQQS